MNQKLTITEIKHICKLSALKIEENDISKFENEINDILNMVDIIKSADTSNIEAISHPFHIEQHLRTDVIMETNQSKEFSNLAPLYESDHYQVPKVIG